MAPLDFKPLIDRAEAISKEFEYGPEDVRKGVKEFLRLMDVGLQNDGEAMTMIPTYVTGVPNGTEKGVYLAVDLGGTNFRVCSVSLSGDTKFTLTQSKVAIPRSMMVSDSHTLFSFLAKQVELFVKTHHADHFLEDPEHHLQLGFTFSFPVDQRAVNKGYLIRWTKGFDIADAIGKDVCELLQTEIDALGLPVKVAALVNDTVGTLMARSYESPGKSGTLLGAIFGTGTNGAYVEKLSKITKMTKPGAQVGDYDTSAGEMVVNTEWGSFDNALKVLPNTLYDRQLDENSVNPGVQMFEKRISGMFLGEILRNAILGLKKDAGLFSATEIPEEAPLNVPWSVDTSVLSFVEADNTTDLSKTKAVLEEQLGIPTAGLHTEEARAIKILVHAIGKRSARLSAVPIAAIVLATGKIKPSSEPVNIPIQNLSLFEQGIQAVKSAFLGKPPAAAIPAYGSVKSDKDKADTKQELEVIDIGVDGSVVEFYPGFEKYVREALREVEELGVEGEKRIRMGVAKDGSGVGAALIALIAARAAGVNVPS
ncbi:glucokinase [Wilcoxina mikolae CBS 423.85]|nr:glucokinase [Wilcoxina mikolae CBS 423.85]